MAQRKVSHFLLALALLASASAVPMMPYSQGLMGFGGAMFGGPFGTFGPQAGQSYICGSSYGACTNRKEEVYSKHVYEPTALVGLQRRLNVNTQNVEGLLAIIEQHGRGRNSKESKFGGFGGGFGGSFGGGYGDFGFGGYGGYGKGAFGLTNGLMGALGGLNGAFGSYGGGGSGSLDLSLEVVVEELAEPIEVLLVFTQASDRDICTGQSVGPVLTRPPLRDQFSGFGASFLHGAGVSQSVERDFGVIAPLTIKAGTNTFSIKGLGDFTDLRDLAGYGIALCEDVVVAVDGKFMCAGEKFEVLYCASLGFTVDFPHLRA